jgi:hypothetical protein
LEREESNREAQVNSLFSRVRARLSFANVTAAIALFVALGGTGYAAVTLPSNSVGRAEIKTGGVGKSEIGANTVGSSEIRGSSITAPDIKSGAVGPSEVRPNAIDSDELSDGGIGAADLSDAAKTAVAAIDAVTFRAAAASDGTAPKGNAKSITRTGTGVYSVDLGTDVSACQSVASVTGTAAALATVAPGATSNVLTVSTFVVPGGTATDEAFSLLVSC